MDKLDKIKAALAEYEDQNARYEAVEAYLAENDPDSIFRGANRQVLQAQWRLNDLMTPETVGLLLAIVEAAAEYRRDGGYEPMAKLFDALKALE